MIKHDHKINLYRNFMFRWYILALFSAFSLETVVIWNTFAPIDVSAKKVIANLVKRVQKWSQGLLQEIDTLTFHLLVSMTIILFSGFWMDGLHYNAVCLVGLSRLPNLFPPRCRTSHLFSPRIRGIFITFCLRNYDHQNTFKCKSKWDAGAWQLIIAISIMMIITIKWIYMEV